MRGNGANDGAASRSRSTHLAPALRPDLLNRIAHAAVAPYFDARLNTRFAAAALMPAEVRAWFRRLPARRAAVRGIGSFYGPARKSVEALNNAAADAGDAVRKAVEAADDKPAPLPVKVMPEIQEAERSDANFDSSEDFLTATKRLRAIKALADDDGAEGDTE